MRNEEHEEGECVEMLKAEVVTVVCPAALGTDRKVDETQLYE
jgi:hypothetical protein